MSQIFHIFRKDARHHWMEILLCQAALVAFCWVQVRGWRDQSFTFTSVTQLIVMLLPLTWCFLIFRLVQSESLVGDRQFWITRPYEWKKLLAEKILFVVVFIHLPLLIAQVVLLIKAGFSPAPHLLGLLWMQLLLVQLPFLPLLALASVTRNLAQGVLALVAVLLLAIGNSVFQLALAAPHYSYGVYTAVAFTLPSRRSDWVEDSVLLVVCLAAVLLQYARRKTAQSRLWLLGGALAMVAISAVTLYARRNRDPFPMPPHQTIAFHAALDPVKLSAPQVPPENGQFVMIEIPVSTSGLPPGTLGRVKGIRIILGTPDGFQWDGLAVPFGLLQSGDNRWRAHFAMEHDAYERLKSVPLKAQVIVAAEVSREQDFVNITGTGNEFEVPRVGRCWIGEWDYHTLHCHSPLIRPSMVVVRLDPAKSTCRDWMDTSLVALDGLPYAWLPRRRSNLPEYGVSPVVSSTFHFESYFAGKPICPGTPLTFSFPEFLEDVRSDFSVENFNLDAYRRATYAEDGIHAPNGDILGLPPLR
jgi:hypothetical protein